MSTALSPSSIAVGRLNAGVGKLDRDRYDYGGS
jgi:hypothetical protein